MSATDPNDADNSSGVTTIDVRNTHRVPQISGWSGEIDVSQASSLLEDPDNYRQITTEDVGEPGEEVSVDVETALDIIDNDPWVWAYFSEGVQYINLYDPVGDNPTSVTVELNPDEVRYQPDLPTGSDE